MDELFLAIGFWCAVVVVLVLALSIWVFCKLTPCPCCPEGRRWGCVVACPELSKRMDSPAPPVRGGGQ